MHSFFLADMYLNGNGVEPNIETAINWLEKSANQGNAEAQNYLGQIYYQGVGVKQNYIIAFDWFKNQPIKSSHQHNTKSVKCMKMVRVQKWMIKRRANI